MEPVCYNPADKRQDSWVTNVDPLREAPPAGQQLYVSRQHAIYCQRMYTPQEDGSTVESIRIHVDSDFSELLDKLTLFYAPEGRNEVRSLFGQLVRARANYRDRNRANTVKSIEDKIATFEPSEELLLCGGLAEAKAKNYQAEIVIDNNVMALDVMASDGDSEGVQVEEVTVG